MSTAKPSTKRDKITKAGSTVFVAVAIAAVILAVTAVTMRFLWQRKTYNDRAISAKTEARDKLQTNASNIDSLLEQFPELDSSNPNSKTILHALPPVYDYPALVTSLDYLAQLSGVQLSGGAGADNSASAVRQSDVSTPLEIPLQLEVTGSYAAVEKFIQNLERSIRPVVITSLSYSGTNDDLTATIQATTYYQPVRSLEVKRIKLE